MTTYDIIIVPDPVLKETAQPVDRVDEAVGLQMDNMVETMYASKGIGLAANQVNLLNRVLVMDVDPDCWKFGDEVDGILTIDSGYRSGEREEEPSANPVIMANPEIVWESEKKSIYMEGCLSIPQQYADVTRPSAVRVKYLGRDGKEHEDLFEGLAAHCVQHEIDHLNGVLFIDYLSGLKRDMILRRVKKLQKDAISL